MKSSQFNLILPTKKDEFLLYNTLANSLLTIDNELKNILMTEKFSDLDPKYIDTLLNMGVIVNSRKSEFLKFLFLYESLKFDTRSSEFIIFPTNSCNLACTYCYEFDYSDLSATMSDDDVNTVIKFIKAQTLQNDSRYCVLSLFGGEPLVKKDHCIKIVKEINKWAQTHNKILYVSMATNGVLIDEDLIDKLFPFIDTLQLTLDGPREIHDHLRVYKNGKGSFDEIIRTINLLKDTRTHISLRIHVDVKDGIALLLEQTELLLDELESLGIKNFPNLHLYFAQRAPKNACDQFVEKEFFIPAEKMGIKIFPQIWSMAKKKGWKDKLDTAQSKVARSILYCGYAKYSTYIVSPNLELHMCPVFTGYREYQIGKLNEKGIPVWNPNYFDLIARTPYEFNECTKCNVLPNCGSGCPIRAYMDSGTFFASNCWTKKELSIERVKAYLQYKYPEKF